MKIVKESPVSMVELKEEIDKIKKRDKEPNIRVQKIEDYLNMFVHLKKDVQKALKDKLSKLEIPRLKEEHISKIIDLLPRDVEELKILLQGYTITVSKENMQRIVEVVNDVVKEK